MSNITFSTFSGADMFVVQKDRVVGEIQGISLSLYREPAPIYTMSNIPLPPATRGKRYYAGSIIFTTIGDLNHPDEPFDVVCTWTQDYKLKHAVRFNGLKLFKDGEFSKEDLVVAKEISCIAKEYIKEVEDLEEIRKLVEVYNV